MFDWFFDLMGALPDMPVLPYFFGSLVVLGVVMFFASFIGRGGIKGD